MRPISEEKVSIREKDKLNVIPKVNWCQNKRVWEKNEGKLKFGLNSLIN